MRVRFLFLLIFLLVIIGLSGNPHYLFAIAKDSDGDSLTDEAESTIYRTDPALFDTDGDGFSDGEEILDGTHPLDAKSSRLAAITTGSVDFLGNPDQAAWYVARGTGIAAFILLTIVVCFGLIISSRAFHPFFQSTTAYETHRFLAWLSLGMVVIHISSFFFDDFLKLRVIEALIPFLVDRPFQTVLGFSLKKTVGVGILAFYGIVILILTSQFRARLSPKVWRAIHYISFPTYVLFLLHGFMSGTDSKEWWMQTIYVISLVLVSILVIVRIVYRNILPKFRSLGKLSPSGDHSPYRNPDMTDAPNKKLS